MGLLFLTHKSCQIHLRKEITGLVKFQYYQRIALMLNPQLFLHR